MPKRTLTRNPIASVDWVLLSMLIALISIGWAMIYAAGYGQGYPDNLSEWLLGTPVGKQTIFVIISMGLLLCTLVIDHRFWRNGAFLVYGLTLLLLIGVLIFG